MIRIIIAILLIILLSCPGEREPDPKEYVPLEYAGTKAEPPYPTRTGIVFTYYDKHCKTVTIVGDFNNWNDNRHFLIKNKYNVWSIILPLKKGKYSYKYSVDGIWIHDPVNPEQVTDEMGDIRSLVTVETDYIGLAEEIYLGYTNAFPPMPTADGVLFTYLNKTAKSVSVGGSFNNWRKDQYYLTRNKHGVWSAVVPLKKGVHRYKFFVDGIWIRDPANPSIEPDGLGEEVSVIKLHFDYNPTGSEKFGPKIVNRFLVRFSYKDHRLPSRTKISLVGSFNKFEEDIHYLLDIDQDKTWECFLELPEGKYYYRYIVDGIERLDFFNPVRGIAEDGKEASVIELQKQRGKELVKFVYFDETCKEVSVVGDFNNWQPGFHNLIKGENNIWYTILQLPPGRYTYMFVVDGKWRLDPGNPKQLLTRMVTLTRY